MQIPKHIYHYTTIESLACILKFKTFKFSRLDCVNDPLEGLTELDKGARKFVYISSWTNNKEDHIPMWKMYAGDMSGVRIKMPSWLFSNSVELVDMDVGYRKIEKISKILPLKTEYKIDGSTVTIERIYGPSDLLYLKDNDAVLKRSSTKQVTIKAGKILNFSLLGDAKLRHWQYEKEWRFRAYLTPHGIHIFGHDVNVMDTIFESEPPKSIGVPYNEKALSEFEVMIGPKASDGSLILLKAVLREYAPDAILKRSGIEIT